jgi:hypothetical protein
MSLQTALNRVAFDVVGQFGAATMAAAMATWNAAWPLIFDEESIAERTVRDWFIPSLVVEESYPATPTADDLQNTIAVVVRTLEAAIAAETAGRITAAQALSLETLFLATW